MKNWPNLSLHKAILLVLIAIAFYGANERTAMELREMPFAPIPEYQADEIINRMSIREKISQLIVLDHCDSNQTDVSGYLLSCPTDKISAQNRLDIPYFFGIDFINQDWSTEQFKVAKEERLASTNDENSVTEYAATLAQNLQLQGINFVIGPSLEINYHDANPLTAKHSFSDTVSAVVTYSSAFVSGMRSTGIHTIVGSYPGIGNMEYGFENEGVNPVLSSRKSQLYRSDMAPFKNLINEGVQGVLISNVHVPAIDSSANILASQSQKVSSVLREELGFKGLIWSNLSSKKDIKPVDALLAGSDVVILSGSAIEKVDEIEQAVLSGVLSEDEINAKCKMVVQAKLWQQKQVKAIKDTMDAKNRMMLTQREVVQKSLTLLKNRKDLIPLQKLDTLKIGVVTIGNASDKQLRELLWRYSPGETHHISFSNLEADYEAFQKKSAAYNLLIVIGDEMQDLPQNRHGISEQYQSIIARIAQQIRTVFVWKGDPLALNEVEGLPKMLSMIATYESTEWTNDYALQAIFGGRSFTGKLNKRIGNVFKRGTGIHTYKVRLAYGIPEEVGISSRDLLPIDKLVADGIANKAMPGCQVWFAKDGTVVVNKAYGYHTYDPFSPVETTDLYDLASITKIAASTPGLIKLSDLGKFDLNLNLCDYLGDWVDTVACFENMGMRDILSHQAGLPSFVPFYSSTLSKGVPRYDIYSVAQSDEYPKRVARELYIRKGYDDQMFRQIMHQKIADEKKYKYSDVGYFFIKKITERLSGTTLDCFLDSVYYKPLGMSTMTFNPLEKFDKSRIPPTEYDRYFRKQLIHGDVHDPGAAMLGGVGGHAGLFSNANDLGKLMEMMLEGGTYGGERFFKKTIIQDYIRCQFCENDNRRGAGFDKPLRNGSGGPSCSCIDIESFGHQGFTGTVTWADPSSNVVYVFLSNRVYPDAENKKLSEMNIRTSIQQYFYEAMKKTGELADKSK